MNLATSDLSDVSITTPATGNVLTYDSTAGKWKNQVPSGGGVTSVVGQTGTVTGAQIAADGGLTTAFAPKAADWATGTAYSVGELVLSSGTLYRCNTAHTAGASFDTTKFDVVSGLNHLSSPWGTEVTVDEFNASSLGASWVRVDKSGGTARITWTEGAGVLSAYNSGGDASQELHAQMVPLSSFGGSLAVGNGFITCIDVLAPLSTNYGMYGLVLADGVTSGAGSQIVTVAYNASTAGVGFVNEPWAFTNYQTGSGATGGGVTFTQGRVWHRLSLVSSGTYRMDVSRDGISWYTFTAFANALVPTYVGLIGSSWGTSTRTVGTFHLLRRVSGVS